MESSKELQRSFMSNNNTQRSPDYKSWRRMCSRDSLSTLIILRKSWWALMSYGDPQWAHVSSMRSRYAVLSIFLRLCYMLSLTSLSYYTLFLLIDLTFQKTDFEFWKDGFDHFCSKFDCEIFEKTSFQVLFINYTIINDLSRFLNIPSNSLKPTCIS